jgi:hypothetical protein
MARYGLSFGGILARWCSYRSSPSYKRRFGCAVLDTFGILKSPCIGGVVACGTPLLKPSPGVVMCSQHMMVWVPSERPTAAQILHHPQIVNRLDGERPRFNRTPMQCADGSPRCCSPRFQVSTARLCICKSCSACCVPLRADMRADMHKCMPAYMCACPAYCALLC